MKKGCIINVGVGYYQPRFFRYKKFKSIVKFKKLYLEVFIWMIQMRFYFQQKYIRINHRKTVRMSREYDYSLILIE